MLEELPETLDETYERILRDINKANRTHTHRLLQCLTVAVRPLRVAELAEVLAVDFETASCGATSKLNTNWRWEDQQQAVVSTCSSLISVVDENDSQIVHFSHFSVKEFLTSSRLAGSSADLSRFHIILEPAHTILAKACLGVLLRLDEHVDRYTVEEIFPLARYAAEHWVDHAQFENVSYHIREEIGNLFDPDKPYFAAWLQVHDIDTAPRYPSTLFFFGLHEKELKMATPLYYASLCGFHDLAEHLIIKDPRQVNANSGHYVSPLGAALSRERLDIAQLLFQHGADVDIQGYGRRTPLNAIPGDGRLEIVEWLLSHGADSNFRSDDLYTPLHIAATEGQVEVSRKLLQHKADQDALDSDGQTPLHLASERGYIDVARLLLEHGVDVNAQNSHRRTPLHMAALCGGPGGVEVTRFLLQHKADQNALDSDGQTPLHLASERGYIDVARLLLEHGVGVDVLDINRSTALHLASKNSRLEVACLLLEHGADVEAEDNSGRTPLQVVSGQQRDEITKLLSKGRISENT